MEVIIVWQQIVMLIRKILVSAIVPTEDVQKKEIAVPVFIITDLWENCRHVISLMMWKELMTDL